MIRKKVLKTSGSIFCFLSVCNDIYFIIVDGIFAVMGGGVCVVLEDGMGFIR